MADEAQVTEPKEEAIVNPFDTNNWKSEPTTVEPVVDKKEDPAIIEKDGEIAEEKPDNTKPNQPEAVPGASPKDIPARPQEEKKEIIPAEELKFANEESEKVYNLLREGKTEDVLTILAEQDKLAKADKMPPADVIKLNLQYQNKEFTPDEINDLFNEKYELPEKPEQSVDELDEEFADRTKKYEEKVKKIEAKIARDAKPAIAELQKLSKEIVLPDTPKAQAETVKEPTQEELDAHKAQQDAFKKFAEAELGKINGYQTTYKDEEVELPVEYKLTAEDKKEILPLIELSNTDGGAFLQKIGWLDDKGQLNTAKIANDLPFILNKEKIMSGIAADTGGKRHAESIKAIKNIDYTGGNNSGVDLGKTPAQAQEEFAGHFFKV